MVFDFMGVLISISVLIISSQSIIYILFVINQQFAVVRRLGSAFHWINHRYPLNNSISFVSVYPLDSDLSAG